MGCSGSTYAANEKVSEPEGKSRIEIVDKTQIDLKKQIRIIKDQKIKAETRANSLKEEALKQKKEGNKNKAILALKMMKLVESNNDKMDGMLLTLEQTLKSLEKSIMSKQVHDVLKSGNEVIKELQEAATLEDFQKIADDLNEQQQINDELARVLGVESINEEMFEDELNELMEKADKDEAEKVRNNLADVPTDSLPEVKNKERKKVEEPEKKQAVLA